MVINRLSYFSKKMSLKRKRTDLTPNMAKIALCLDTLSIVLGYYLTSDEEVTLVCRALPATQIKSSLSRVVTEWMRTTWGIKKYIPLHPRRALSHYVFPGMFSIEILFLSAVERNDVPLLRTLHQTECNLFPTDRRLALSRAISKGHVSVMECLHASFGVTKHDIVEKNGYALYDAAKNGHVSVFQCLFTTYGLTKEILGINNMHMFRLAAHHHQMEVLQYFHQTFGLTIEYAHRWHDVSQQHSIGKSHQEVVHELEILFDVSKEVICRCQN